MITDAEDILTLPLDFLSGTSNALVGELVDLDEVLCLSEDFPLELPLASDQAPLLRVFGDGGTLTPPPEYLGELDEVLQPAPPPAAAVALVPQRRPAKHEVSLAVTALAAPHERARHVVFSLAGIKYAVPMEQVLEVRELEHFTPVMNVPAWVLGVTNLHGDIVSLVDLQRLLEVPAGGSVSRAQVAPPGRTLIVVQTLKGDLTTCLAVESVDGVVQAAVTEIQAVERIIGDGLTPFTRGLLAQGAELLSVLNLESLLHSLEIAL
jgi:purine-binding chemotaxis protein CheW